MSTGPYNNIGSSRYCGKEKPCTTKGQPKSTEKIGKNNLGNAQQDIIHLTPFHFLLAYQRENYNRKGGVFCDAFDIDVEISY